MATNDLDPVSKGILAIFVALLLGSGITSVVYGAVLLIRYMGIPYTFGMFSVYCASIALICIGGLIIITLLVGVLGAWKDHANFRIVALVLAIFLFISLAVIGTWAMIIFKTDRLQKSIDVDIKNLYMNYHTKSDQRDKVDWLNKHHQCCGTTELNEKVPTSCCLVPTSNDCGKNPLSDAQTYYQKGCALIYKETKSKVVYQLDIVTLACAGAMLLAIILYSILTKRAREGYANVPH